MPRFTLMNYGTWGLLLDYFLYILATFGIYQIKYRENHSSAIRLCLTFGLLNKLPNVVSADKKSKSFVLR